MKPGKHLIGSRVETGCFQAMGPTALNLCSPTPCAAHLTSGAEGQALSCEASAPRVVASTQWRQVAGSSAIVCSAVKHRLGSSGRCARHTGHSSAFLDVAVQVECEERAKFVTGFSRWVKGQAQRLEPGSFKLWVNCIRTCTAPPGPPPPGTRPRRTPRPARSSRSCPSRSGTS